MVVCSCSHEFSSSVCLNSTRYGGVLHLSLSSDSGYQGHREADQLVFCLSFFLVGFLKISKAGCFL